MSAEWPTVKLGEHCLKIGSGSTPRGGASVYLENGETCLIRSQNIYNEGFKSEGLVYITTEAANKLNNVIVEKNDVLLNITGDSVARVCLANDAYIPARVNQHVAIIRPNPEEFDARYLRYLLVSPKTQNHLLTIAAVGATRNALTKGMIETLDVAKPPIETQSLIADKLESLDKKIELNRQTNQTLEQIAQAIFKSWFVDFEPTRAKIIAKEQGANLATQELAAQAIICGAITLEQLAEVEQNLETTLQQAIDEKLNQHNQTNPTALNAQQLKTTAALFPNELVESELGSVPEGWRNGSISDVASVRGGYAFKGKLFVDKGNPVIKIKNITGNGGVDLAGSDCIDDEQAKLAYKFKLEDGDLLMAMTGATVGKIGLVVTEGRSVYLNQRVAKFESERFGRKISWFLFCCFKRTVVFDSVVGAAQGSAQPNISASGIESTEIVVASAEVIEFFCQKVHPLFQAWLQNINENKVLEELRDTLLPKLLSGELKINKEVN